LHHFAYACTRSQNVSLEEIQFRSDVTVELVKSSAADADVVFAARVSTMGERSLADVDADAGGSGGLIRFLMRERRSSCGVSTCVTA
jgi:thymidylate synthase (FAD)